jgi:hypothetical protein
VLDVGLPGRGPHDDLTRPEVRRAGRRREQERGQEGESEGSGGHQAAWKPHARLSYNIIVAWKFPGNVRK